jgi:hypothetical protein
MNVRLLLVIGCVLIGSTICSQKNFIRTYYDKWFPNNIYVKNEVLSKQNDSLKALNDSLFGVQSLAIDKINLLKSEIVNLKGELLNQQRNLKTIQDSTFYIRKELEDSIQELRYFIVSCNEQIVQSGKYSLPELVNTCFWRDYKLIETGKPDIKGRYTWKSEFFLSTAENESVVQPSSLFKPEKMDELVQLVNQRLNEDFLAMTETEPICFDRKLQFMPFKFEDMRITLSENGGMHFEVNYNLAENCFEVSTASVSFMMKEIKSFLNKN